MADNLDTEAGRFLGAIQEAALSVVEQIMEDMARDLRDRLSTPYPPSSREGEDPHLRSGNLQAGVAPEVVNEGTRITARLVSRREPSKRNDTQNVPGILNFVMDRPYLQHMFEDWSDNGRFREDFIRELYGNR